MRVDDLIIFANEKASDIHFDFSVLPPKFRVNGRLESMADFILNDEDCDNYAMELASYKYDDFLEVGEMDLANSERTGIACQFIWNIWIILCGHHAF